MTDIQHTIRKTDKTYFFEVDLSWISRQTGVLSSKETDTHLQVATPPAFGGEGRDWSPELLLLSSVSSCFMSTLFFFLKKQPVTITHFECNAIGQVHHVNGHLQFTHIDLYPKIYVSADTDMEAVRAALQKTDESCLVANSLNVKVVHHSEVSTTHPATK